jgi:hypothetical protein
MWGGGKLPLRGGIAVEGGAGSGGGGSGGAAIEEVEDVHHNGGWVGGVPRGVEGDVLQRGGEGVVALLDAVHAYGAVRSADVPCGGNHEADTGDVERIKLRAVASGGGDGGEEKVKKPLKESGRWGGGAEATQQTAGVGQARHEEVKAQVHDNEGAGDEGGE